MVSVKQCCCGCSLRTGSLIILWLGLISDCINVFFSFGGLLLVRELAATIDTPTYNDPDFPSTLEHHEVEYIKQAAKVSTTIFICLIIRSGIGVAFWLCGIIGIIKNIPKYVSFGVYYLGFIIGYCTLFILLLIFVPGMSSIIAGPKASNEQASAIVPAYVVMYLFGLALTSYFFIVVKSYRDEMIRITGHRGTNEVRIRASETKAYP